MHLHPDDVTLLFDEPDIRGALQATPLLDNVDDDNAQELQPRSYARPRRLELAESRAATADHQRGLGGTDEGTVVLYEEGREWWERCAMKG